MRHSAIAVSGPQTDSSIVQGGLRSPKAATEPNPNHRNLRSSGSLELGPIGGTPWVSVFPRPFLVILAVTERRGLIAKKSPPRLVRPSASNRHVAGHGGLGNAETEHPKFTMDPWRSPQKVLVGHLCDQLADFTGNPRAPTAPATTRSISPKR